MAINFRGYLFKDNGDPVEGATVQLLNTGTTTVKDTFSGGTTSAGLWYFSESDQDKYDVKITSGSSIRYIRWNDQISVKEVDVRNDTNATTPAATFTNLTNATANQVAVFSGANTTRADGDEIYLSFKLADSAGNIDEFARMTVDAADVTSGEEDGQIRFSVAVDGTLTDVFTINSSESGGTDMTLDVSGDLTLDADGGDILFKDGGTTFGSATNTSGNLIIKSGTTTALTFSGANLTAAGTIGSGNITSTGTVQGTTITATTAFVPDASDGAALGTTSLEFSDLYLADGAVIGFGDDQEVTLTHVHDTGLLLSSTDRLQFGDAGTFIHQSADGVLTIESDTTVDINGAVVFAGALTGITNITLSGTLSDGNYTFDTSGNVSGLGTVASGAITSSGIIKTDDATEATSTTDGSLQTDGGLSVVKDAVFGDDVKLLSDSAVIALGADGDTTLTHTDGTGLTLNSTNKLTFGDAASFIQQSADGTLRVDGEAIIDLNASTRVDVSAALTVGTDVNIGDDLSLTSDSAVFNMGAGNDFTITHDGTTGATLAGNPITITAAGASTWSTSSGALTITSAAAATWSTAAGALTIDGDDGITLQTTGSGNVTVSEILDITDATDSSDATGDTGALRTEGGASIAKKLYVGTDLDVDGTTNLDAVDIDGAVQIDGTVTVGVDDTGLDVKFFGASAGAYMEWDESADQLRIMGASADATTSTGKLLLATSLTDINANDVIGKVEFQAPHEAGGTDAITVAASIQAIAQATFSSSVNATDLIFYTGHSEAATEKFRFTSQGEIGIGGANYGTDGQVLTSGGAGAAPAWEDAAGISGLGSTDNAVLRANGTGGATAQGSSAIITDGGSMFIGDTAHSGVTTGLVFNQGAADDIVFALKSSDIDHGLTSGLPNANMIEADDYFVMKKGNVASGGVLMESLCENVATGGLNLIIEAVGATAHTTKSSSGRSLVEFYVAEHDGSNALADITANGNIFNIRARVGGSDVTRMIVDEDGDLYSTTSAQTFDEYDDAHMVRALDQVKGDVIRDKWDDYVQYNEQALIDADVLGAPVSEGGLTNVTQLQRLHNGAIWQGYTRQMEMQERMEVLENKLLAIEGGK